MSSRLYNFTFGFETPRQSLNNRRRGWDDENSWGFWILAESRDAAIAWGRQVAEEFVRRLYAQACLPARSWERDGFAHWIAADTPEPSQIVHTALIPIITDGEMPDFSAALAHWKE